LSTAFTKLFFNGIVQSVTASTADYQPSFICPNCKTKNVLPTKTSVAFQASKTFDFNQKVTFTLPCCGANVELFVAVHKDANGALSLCVQKSSEEGASGIPASWWQRYTP
jgi:hypothetical protein